jgi:hypothetical protein
MHKTSTLIPPSSELLVAHQNQLAHAARKGAMSRMLKVMAVDSANEGFCVFVAISGYSENTAN